MSRSEPLFFKNDRSRKTVQHENTILKQKPEEEEEIDEVATENIHDVENQQFQNDFDQHNFDNISLLPKDFTDEEHYLQTHLSVRNNKHPANRTNRIKVSFVWKYFDYIITNDNNLEKTLVQCNICPRRLKLILFAFFIQIEHFFCLFV